jgi:hypothetical protein
MGKMSQETQADLENRRLRYEQARADCRSLVTLARIEAPENEMSWMLSRIIDAISDGATGATISALKAMGDLHGNFRYIGMGNTVVGLPRLERQASEWDKVMVKGEMEMGMR